MQVMNELEYSVLLILITIIQSFLIWAYTSGRPLITEFPNVANADDKIFKCIFC